jgi:hypothetical protein
MQPIPQPVLLWHGITANLSTPTTAGDIMFRLYDITGAAQSPFDKATTAYGDQVTGGNLITASLTPSAPNELVLNETQIDFHTINGVIGTGFVLDSVVNGYDDNNPPSGGTETSTLDEDNGNAHIYATTTSPLIFVYTYTQPFQRRSTNLELCVSCVPDRSGGPYPEPEPDTNAYPDTDSYPNANSHP